MVPLAHGRNIGGPYLKDSERVAVTVFQKALPNEAGSATAAEVVVAFGIVEKKEVVHGCAAKGGGINVRLVARLAFCSRERRL